MHKLFFSLLYIIFSISAIANSNELDSLKMILSSIKTDDKIRLCEIYQNIAVCYETINLDSTLYYVNKGLSLYDEPDYKDWGYLQLINTEANYYYSMGDFEKAKNGFASAFINSLKMNDRDYGFDASAAMSLGVVYRKLGNQDSTLYYYNTAADASKP